MRYLGVDYGKRKVGLAVSDGTLASPLKSIAVTGLTDALTKIQQVTAVEDIEQVVVGVPESGEARTIVKRFIQELGKKVTVVEADETLSSYQARQTMVDLGKSRKKLGAEDAYSAALILQNYLDLIRL